MCLLLTFTVKNVIIQVQIYIPIGDGNHISSFMTEPSPKLQFTPLRGRKQKCFSYGFKVFGLQFTPLRGRKLIKVTSRTSSAWLQFTPLRGRQPSFAYPLIAFSVVTIYPITGTETQTNSPSSHLYPGYNYPHYGDGNLLPFISQYSSTFCYNLPHYGDGNE